MKSTLLFIPAKDEENSISRTIDESRVVFNTVESADLSILVIDDGSTDKTSEHARHSGAHVIRHEKNEGLGATFKEAVEYALNHNFDILVTIDADGQFSPAEIPLLYEPIASGSVEVATGSRFLDKSVVTNMPISKRLGNHLMSALISSIVDTRFRDVSCGFRVYSREALLRLHLFGRFTYTQEVFLNLSHKNMRIKEVAITVKYFPARKSRIANSLIKYARQTIKIIIKAVIYYRPLRFFGSLAALLWCISVPISTALAIRYALTDTVSPFKSIGITMLALFGLGFVSITTGIILQIVSRLQMTAEDILYYEKKYSK